MTTNLKTLLNNTAGGLFLMTIFTAFWGGMAAYNLYGRDFGVVGIAVVAVVVFFISSYIKIIKAAKTLPGITPAVKTPEEKRIGKGFMIIGSLEGFAIFLTANVLINLNLFNYFVPAMALIVGLHFFPLGYLFKRRFDYFTGAYTCMVAFLGILLTRQQLPVYLVIAIVGIGCALTTIAHGIRMIVQSRKALQQS